MQKSPKVVIAREATPLSFCGKVCLVETVFDSPTGSSFEAKKLAIREASVLPAR